MSFQIKAVEEGVLSLLEALGRSNASVSVIEDVTYIVNKSYDADIMIDKIRKDILKQRFDLPHEKIDLAKSIIWCIKNNKPRPNKAKLTDADLRRMRYFRVELEMTQREIAKEMRLSVETISITCKKHGWIVTPDTIRKRKNPLHNQTQGV